jgi:hypothetical protein
MVEVVVVERVHARRYIEFGLWETPTTSIGLSGGELDTVSWWETLSAATG